MKKRILSVVAMLLIVCSMMICSIINVEAEESNNRLVDGSYLTMEESSTAEVTYNPLLRGEHLMDGTITISKSGTKKIFVYASTTGNHVVDYIRVDVFVEEYNPDTDNWDQVDWWSAEAENDYYVVTQKMLEVEGGHYYRVRGEHFAGNNDEALLDESGTVTDGIWVD